MRSPASAAYIPGVLEQVGYEPGMAPYAAADDACLGRVLRVDRGLVRVLTEDGIVAAGSGGDLLDRAARDAMAAPATGDWVVVRDWPDHRQTVETVLPRRTSLVRASAGAQSEGQLVCANADLVGVVVGLEPIPALALVERLVALAWQSGARPVVVLTKADRVRDADLVAEDVTAAAPGVEVVVSSVETGEGLDRLRGLVEGRLTLALVGASGHGKSSLANALAGSTTLATREIRADGRGRHTSVRRELVPLPGGGAVVDTPGLRGVGMFGDGAGVGAAFADIEALAQECRYADCGHGSEPGCAVTAALEEGRLPLSRLEHWRALTREVAFMAQRREARLKQSRSPKRPRRDRRRG